MGGWGSGRWGGHSKADTVEECLILDVAKLARDKLLLPLRAGTLHWKNTATGKEVSSCGYVTGPLEGDEMLFTLQYRITRTSESIELPIRLQVTYPNLGGKRWWFTCPLVVAGQPCRRRVGKLYLPPGGKYYGCRHCYELTYESAQKHDPRISVMLRNPVAFERLCKDFWSKPLSGQSLVKAHLLIKADTVLFHRYERRFKRRRRAGRRPG
jgi:hypothetical protein